MAFRLKNNAYQQKSGINYSSPAKAFGPEAIKKGLENEKPKGGKDPYADAAKKDSKLGDYVKARKTMKKGSAEWNANQNKINAAYGVKKRYDEGKKETAKVDSKTTVTGKGDDNIKTRGKNQNASKVNDSEKKSNKDVAKSDKRVKVDAAKDNLKKTKKENKVEKIEAKADVATAKGKTKKADRLNARAERKETGKSKKDQGRNIFGRKTRKQKKKEAAAALAAKKGTTDTASGKTTSVVKYGKGGCECGKPNCDCK